MTKRNQCDGCCAGIPAVNGVHRMGRPGGYSDPQGCTAAQYYDHWNSPDILPPVGCPIVLRIGCAVVQAERTAHIERRDREMTYKLPTGQELVGRYPWTYR